MIPFVTFFGFISITRADNTSGTAPQPFHTPSPSGYSLGSWVTISDFKLQPDNHYYSKTKQTVTIKTEVNKNDVSSFFGGKYLSGVNYKWYKYDGKKWREIRKPGLFGLTYSTNTSSYSFTSDTPGTYYLQAFAQVLPPLPYFNPPLYSNMTAVTFSNESEITNNLSIQPQSNYLLVNNDFLKKGYYLKVTPDPITANDSHDIHWSFPDDSSGTTIDKTSNDLISIKDNQIFVNPNAGSILSHKHIPSQLIKIKGSLINGLGKEIDAYTYVTVGNMLTIKDNKTTFSSGESTVLTLNGEYNDKDKIHWHRIKNSEDEEINNPTNSLSLNSLTKKDNNTRYYIEIISENPVDENKPFKVKSNEIHIGVDSNDVNNDYDHTISSVYADNTHINNALNIGNAEVTDHLTHTVSITNRNNELDQALFRNNELIYPLSKNERVIDSNSIKINNYNIPLKNITIDDKNIVHIRNVPIENYPVKVTIDTLVTKIDESSFEYKPLFTVYISYGESYTSSIEPMNYISFIVDGIVPIAHNLEYGQVIKKITSLKDRISPDGDNNIVDFNDNRRKKNPAKLELDFSDKFHYSSSKKSSSTNSLELRYFDQDQNELGILNKKIVVEQTKQGESIKPVSWLSNEGLKIFIRNTNLDDGSYKSKLTWTTTWSI